MTDGPLAIALRIAVRLALCAAVTWAVWRVVGVAGLVLTAPLYGVALAKPLLDLASDLRHGMRAAVWQRVEGRHHAYRGVPVQVLEDDSRHRWVRVADVRQILGHTTSDGAFALTYPNGWRLIGQPPQPHLSDAALIAHLAKDASPEALRLRQWVEREIAFPAKRVRDGAARNGLG